MRELLSAAGLEAVTSWPDLAGIRGEGERDKIAAMNTQERIKQQVTGNRVVLYMKGTPSSRNAGSPRSPCKC